MAVLPHGGAPAAVGAGAIMQERVTCQPPAHLVSRFQVRIPPTLDGDAESDDANSRSGAQGSSPPYLPDTAHPSPTAAPLPGWIASIRPWFDQLISGLFRFGEPAEPQMSPARSPVGSSRLPASDGAPEHMVGRTGEPNAPVLRAGSPLRARFRRAGHALRLPTATVKL